MNQQIVRADLVDHLAIIDGQIFKARIGGFHDDLGLVARGAQDTIDPEYLVSDGIAVPERREDLVDARHYFTTGPAGTRLTISFAGGSVRRRRANHPGSGSAGVLAGSFFRRSNVSRYFRSMTGHV